MIDWNTIINNLSNGYVVTVDPERWNMNNPEYARYMHSQIAGRMIGLKKETSKYYDGYIVYSCVMDYIRTNRHLIC